MYAGPAVFYAREPRQLSLSDSYGAFASPRAAAAEVPTESASATVTEPPQS